MAQRVLEPGEIETLAQRSIPRIRLADPAQLFLRRAARLRQLAPRTAIADYLEFLALLVDAQHAAAQISAPVPAHIPIITAGRHGRPPIHAASWPLATDWHDTLQGICASLASQTGFPDAVGASIEKIRRAPPAWLNAQAGAILQAQNEPIDAPGAPFIMAALQVHWTALASQFVVDKVNALDVPGLCPLCGTLPVSSIVYAKSPLDGYRYLHCALCATEWHMVRVQCTQCGASGKDIGYHTLESAAEDAVPAEDIAAAVRAESCESCHGYRKILYQEKDTAVEAVADDVASVALDLLMAEHGYHRFSSNPLLWLERDLKP
jgi:FdhE protein